MIPRREASRPDRAAPRVSDKVESNTFPQTDRRKRSFRCKACTRARQRRCVSPSSRPITRSRASNCNGASTACDVKPCRPIISWSRTDLPRIGSTRKACGTSSSTRATVITATRRAGSDRSSRYRRITTSSGSSMPTIGWIAIISRRAWRRHARCAVFAISSSRGAHSAGLTGASFPSWTNRSTSMWTRIAICSLPEPFTP